MTSLTHLIEHRHHHNNAGRPPRPPPVKLLPGAVYRSPLGHRCRLYLRPQDRASAPTALLLYDLPDGSPADRYAGSGFVLSRANFHLLHMLQPPPARTVLTEVDPQSLESQP